VFGHKVVADANGRPTSGPAGVSGGISSVAATKPLNLTLASQTITGSVDVMTGASAVAAGLAGVVPAPAAGENDEVFHGDGSYRRVDIAELEFTGPDKIATRTAAGAGAGAEVDFTPFMRTLADDVNQAAAQATLGVVPGTNVQPQDAELTAIAGLTSAADRVPYFTGLGVAALAVFTGFARTLVAAIDAAAARIVLGVQIGVDVAAQVHTHVGLLAGLTSGYLPKATSATAVGNGPVYTDGTSIALGNTSPTERIHVTVNGGRAGAYFEGLGVGGYAAHKYGAADLATEFVAGAGYGGVPGYQIVDTAATPHVRLNIDLNGVVSLPYKAQGPLYDQGAFVLNARAPAYGIVGNGVADDTAAIQALIDSMTSGQRVVFPPGRYKISATIVIGDGSTAGASSVNYLTIQGAGHGLDSGFLNPGYGGSTVFEWAGAAGDPMFQVNGPITVNLHDFDVLGYTGGNACGDAIRLYYAIHSTVERVSIRKHGGIGFKIAGYATRPTGASQNGAKLTMLHCHSLFGTGNAYSGLELGDQVESDDPCSSVFFNCAFIGELNGAAATFRFTDNNSFHQCNFTNYGHGPVLRIKPVAGWGTYPAENAFYNCPMVGDTDKIVVIDETDQAWTPYLTTFSFWPFPVGDAGGVAPLPTDVRLSGFTDSGIWFGHSLAVSSHLDTAGAQPTVTAGAGAGTGPTITRWNCTDTAGLITLVAGTSPTGAATVLTVTFARTYGTRPHVILSPWNATAAALTGNAQVWAATSGAAAFTISVGTTALNAGSTYAWTYHVIGY
jgi:hypothetical protein